jgi:hypothetical protein
MRHELSIAASIWLAAAPIPIASSASVLTAFVPGTAKSCASGGPHRLYRAAGWDSPKGTMASATPAGTRYYLFSRQYRLRERMIELCTKDRAS